MSIRKKQLTFDLDTKIAKKILGNNFSNVYKEIENFLDTRGFNHLQGTVYASEKSISSLEIKNLIDKIKEEYPYIVKCVRDMRQTSILGEFSLNKYFDYDGSPGIYEDYYLLSNEEKEKVKFIEKIKQLYNPLSKLYTYDNLISEIKEQISGLLEDNNIDINIKDIMLSGSRCRGLEEADSDIDIILHYEGDIKEDILFNILSEFPLILESQIVDINPVRDEEHDFIEYLHGVEEYLDNKRHDIIANNTPKTRLFVDIDGTLAVFKPVDTLETLYEKGYFLNLEPHENVVAAVNELTKNDDIEVFIMSSVLSDSKYALDEKNEWINKYLPQIDMEHRIFPPCGSNKVDYIPEGVRTTDCLLDDYTHNLTLWQPPAKGIKLLNGINHTHGTWQHDRLDYNKSGHELAKNIIDIVQSGIEIKDLAPAKESIVEIAEKMTSEEISAFIDGIEVSIDYQLEIDENDFKLYKYLTSEYKDNLVKEPIPDFNNEAPAVPKIIEKYSNKGFDMPYTTFNNTKYINNLAISLMYWEVEPGLSDETIVFLAKMEARYVNVKKVWNELSNKDEKLLRDAVLKEAGIISFEELSTKDYVILDTETTGFNEDDEVIELGITDSTGNILYESNFRPFVEINPDAARVTGITDEELSDAPDILSKLDKIINLIGDKDIVIYNKSFDTRMILQTIDKHLEVLPEELKFNVLHLREFLSNKFDNNTYCIMQSYTDFTGRYKSTSLINSLSEHGLKNVQRHRAVSDCLDTAALINHCSHLQEQVINNENIYVKPDSLEITKKIVSNLGKEVAGTVEWSSPKEACIYIDKEHYLKCIQEEYEYKNTTGFKYETITHDPSTKKEIDDYIYDLYGEKNPKSLEDYKDENTSSNILFDKEVPDMDKEQNKEKGLSEKEQQKNEMIESIKSMAEEYAVDPDKLIELFKFKEQFYNYSLNNSLLIAMQNPNSIFVGSYKKFKDMGYNVKRGEHGMKILVPQTLTRFFDGTSWKSLRDASPEEKKRIKERAAAEQNGKQFENDLYKSYKRNVFGIGHVFDIAQTDCPAEKYPEIIGLGFSSEQHKQLFDVLSYFSQTYLNCPVIKNDFSSATLRGLYNIKERKIEISSLLQDTQALSTLTHEMGHAILHNDRTKSNTPTCQKELEADALSIMLDIHLGLDVPDARRSHLHAHFCKFNSYREEHKDDENVPSVIDVLNNVEKIYRNVFEDIDSFIENTIDKDLSQHRNLTLPDKYPFVLFPYSEADIDTNKVYNIKDADELIHSLNNNYLQYNLSVAEENQESTIKPTNFVLYLSSDEIVTGNIAIGQATGGLINHVEQIPDIPAEKLTNLWNTKDHIIAAEYTAKSKECALNNNMVEANMYDKLAQTQKQNIKNRIDYFNSHGRAGEKDIDVQNSFPEKATEPKKIDKTIGIDR